MRISTVTDSTKQIEPGQQDWYCAVGKGGEDRHLNARSAAVRVKTIVYLHFYLAVPSENRYIKENSANIPP